MDRCHGALSEKLKMVGFRHYKTDPYLWMQDYGDHYEYITVYSDDILVFRKDPIVIFRVFNILLPVKVVGEPELYLGVDVGTA